MSERDLVRYAIIAAVAFLAWNYFKNGGMTSIRNLGGTPIGGTPNIGGRGGM
jgi:hypothetical protein